MREVKSVDFTQLRTWVCTVENCTPGCLVYGQAEMHTWVSKY